MIWKVAVTWAPGRKQCTLRRTLESIYAAGWSEVLVSGDGQEPPKLPGLSVEIARRCSGLKRLGPWPHWLDVVRHCLGANMPWDMLLMVQDDVTLAAGARGWMDALQENGKSWAATPGLVSLWLPSFFVEEDDWLSDKNPPMDQVTFFSLPEDDLPRRAYGALALVVPRHIAVGLSGWKNHTGMSRADYQLGRFCKEFSWSWYYPTRSLCQHIGEGDSTLDTGTRSPLYRIAQNPVLDCWLS